MSLVLNSMWNVVHTALMSSDIDIVDPTWRKNPWRHFVITDMLCDIIFVSEAPATGRHAAKMFRFIWNNGEALPLVEDDRKFRKWFEDNKYHAVVADITEKMNAAERKKHISLSELGLEERLPNPFRRETRTWNVNLETLKITFEDKYETTVFQPTSGTSKYLEKPKSTSIIKS